MNRTWTYILLVIVVFSLGACRPKGVLSSRQMRSVLIDLHMAEATISAAGLRYGHSEEQEQYYSQVLSKHGITQAQFDSSLVWYTDHPELFDKIYPKVVDQLEQDYQQWLDVNQKALERQRHIHTQAEAAHRREQEALMARRIDSLQWVFTHGSSLTDWLQANAFCPDTVAEPVIPFLPK